MTRISFYMFRLKPIESFIFLLNGLKHAPIKHSFILNNIPLIPQIGRYSFRSGLFMEIGYSNTNSLSIPISSRKISSCEITSKVP